MTKKSKKKVGGVSRGRPPVQRWSMQARVDPRSGIAWNNNPFDNNLLPNGPHVPAFIRRHMDMAVYAVRRVPGDAAVSLIKLDISLRMVGNRIPPESELPSDKFSAWCRQVADATNPRGRRRPSRFKYRSQILQVNCQIDRSDKYAYGDSGDPAGGGRHVVLPDVLSRRRGSPIMESHIDRSQIERVVLKNAADVTEAQSRLWTELDRVQIPVVEQVQSLLDMLVGHSFGSLEENKHAAKGFQRLFERMNVRPECARDGCHELARFECAAAGRTKRGAFRCVHPVDGRFTTHFSSTSMPGLKLRSVPDEATP